MKKFPLEFNFARGPLRVILNTKDEFAQWMAQERQFWGKFGASPGDQTGTAIVNNLSRLDSISPDNAAADASERFQKEYIPTQSGLARMADHLGTRDQNLARAFLNEVNAPGSGGWRNDGALVEAKALAALFRVLGDPAALRESIGSAQAEVERVRAGDSEVLKRFNNLVSMCEAEWKAKFEGYEAKVALKAPREYWSARFDKHDGLARRARSGWQRSLLATGLCVGLLAILLLSSLGDALLQRVEMWLGLPIGSLPADAASQLASFAKRAVVFGTVLGMAVWWLRQKLRDLRSHEHLAEDAAERVTMIETYAAMKGAGLEASDLAPILAALYRPALTGLIDDSGPTLPIEVLMKGVGDTVSRAGRGGA